MARCALVNDLLQLTANLLLPSSMSESMVLPMTSRRAVGMPNLWAVLEVGDIESCLLGSRTFQNSTASTSTGTVSLVRVFLP